VVIATFMGFCYGTNLSLFLLTKDNWGLKNFGINYGSCSPPGESRIRHGPIVTDADCEHGQDTSSFLTAAVLLVIGAILSVLMKGKERAATVAQK